MNGVPTSAPISAACSAAARAIASLGASAWCRSTAGSILTPADMPRHLRRLALLEFFNVQAGLVPTAPRYARPDDSLRRNPPFLFYVIADDGGVRLRLTRRTDCLAIHDAVMKRRKRRRTKQNGRAKPGHRRSNTEDASPLTSATTPVRSNPR
jgi:hypothetical protein